MVNCERDGDHQVFSQCYGDNYKWLYLFYPSLVTDAVKIKNRFLLQCEKQNLINIQAIKLIDVIDLY
jgi:hypothetical protein